MKKFFSRFQGSFYMFVESVRMSVNNIMQNKLRSFLTILGILIGVAAVIALITTISGVSNSISDSFTSMGAGTMTLTITGTELKTGIEEEDMQAIAALDHVEGVCPSITLTSTITVGDVSDSYTVSGKNDYFFVQAPDAVERGRNFSRIDTDSQNRVCLISAGLVNSHFYGVDPLGRTLYLDNRDFTVVGVLSEDDDLSLSTLFTGAPDVYIPYSTALKLSGLTSVNSLTLYIDDIESADIVEAELEVLLDPLFNYEDDVYSINSMESIGDTMEEMMGMMSMLLAGIASIALVVGGIGIMNMMLTSVTERTVEIGLKKAIGAEPGQIQLQFLIESFLLSIAGGIAGIILGLILSATLCNIMSIKFSISYGAIALGVGFSAAVGIIFGWSPARKASRLSPIDALRRM